LKTNGHGLAVVANISWDRASKKMFVGQRHAGQKWRDVLGWEDSHVLIDAQGFGTFPVGHRSVAVWISEKAPEFGKISEFTFPKFGRDAGGPSVRLGSV
jgi:alpha-amylase